MKKIFLGLAICLGLACSEAKQDKVEDAISNTSDSLNAKLNKLNDTLKKVKDDVANKIPKVKLEIDHTVPISLQWISFEEQGSAKVNKEADGWFTIKGEQTNNNNEYLKINGKLKRVNPEQIVFDGTIITYIKSNNGGIPCEKNGKQIFLKKGDRKYYRLQNMENCAGGRLIDYVDIYQIDNVL